MWDKLRNISIWQWILLLLSVILLIGELDDLGDFKVFYYASIDLLENGKNIYLIKYGDGYNYFYGLFFAISIYPLTVFSVDVANVIWTLLNFALMLATLKILLEWSGFWKLNKKQQVIFGFILTILSYQYVKDNLHNSQVTFLIVFIFIQGLKWITEKKNLQGSLLLGFGIAMKLFPIVLLPYLFYRKWFLAGVLTLVCTAFFYIAPTFFIGFENNTSQLKSQVELLSLNNDRHILDAEEADFYCLSNWCTTLLIEDVPSAKLDYKRNIADVSLDTLKTVQNLFRLFFVALTLIVIKWPPFVTISNHKRLLYEVCYILAIIPLIFPHQQFYSYFMAIPAFVFVLEDLVRNHGSTSVFRKILFVLCFLLFSIYLLIGEWIPIYHHFKLIIYASFILIGLLLTVKDNSEDQ